MTATRGIPAQPSRKVLNLGHTGREGVGRAGLRLATGPGDAVGVTEMPELLERDAFLAALEEYADDARSGRGRLVLISGEAGVGKSSLLEAFRDRIPAASWLAGACDGMFTPRALGPVYDIAEVEGGELAAACASGSREQMYAAVRASLATPRQLNVLVIEDVHWADEATLDLLPFLARRITDSPALILVTYRDESLQADDPLQVVLGRLATERVTRRIGLTPLSLAAVERLAHGTIFAAPELKRLTGGNPFFISELLACGTELVPASARDAVISRSAGLSAQGRAVLRTAALIGSQVDADLLREVGEAEAAALDECIGSGLLAADGGVLRFRHEIARLALEAATPPQQAIETHQRILDALLARGIDDHSRLAHHAESAGDVEQILAHAPAAGREAAALAAHREAAAQFQRAARHVSAVDDRTAGDLYDALADELTFIDRFEEAAEARELALARWRALGEPLRVGDGLRRQAVTMWRLCRGEETRAYGLAALAELEPLPPSRELALAAGNVATDRIVDGDVDEAQRLIDLGMGIAEGLGEGELLAQLTTTAAGLAILRGEDPRSLLSRALELALEHGHEARAGAGYANLQAYFAEWRQLDPAVECYQRGMSYCDGRDLATYTNCLRGAHTSTLLHRGEFDDCLALTQELLDQPGLSPVNRLTPLMSHGLALARRGDVAPSWEALDEALASAISVDEADYIVPARLARAEARWLQGNSAAAAEDAAAAARALETRQPWIVGEVAIWQSRLGIEPVLNAKPAAPYALELAGDHAGAAAAWDELGCPYDAATALLGSDDEELLRDAQKRLIDLGVPAAALMARRRLKAIGAQAIPVGPRKSTSSHPFGLTRREQEILELLCRDLANGEIADQLVVSERTVENHVSAILSKLDVRSRRRAAQRARELELVPQG